LTMRRKALSVLVAVVFFLSIMLPLSQPGYATGTTYTPLTVPNVSDDTTTKLGSFQVEIDPYYSDNGGEALVELPKDYEIKDLTVADKEIDYTRMSESVSTTVYGEDGEDGKNTTTVTITKITDRSFKLELQEGGISGAKLRFPITFESVKVPSGVSGDIVAKIVGVAGQLVSGSVVIGTVGAGDLEVEVLDTENFSDAGGSVEIRVAETAAGKLNEEDELELELPDGFEWGDIEEATLVYGAFGGSASIASIENAVEFTPDGDTLKISLSNDAYKSTVRVAFDFTVSINVTDTSEAEYGDVIAKVKGDYTATPSEIVVGTYGDYEVTINADDSSIVAYAGQTDQDVSDIVIKESLKGSLIGGRSILITLPSNARWYKIDDTELYDEDGNVKDLSSWNVDEDNEVKLEFAGLQGTDDRTAKFIVNGDSTNATDPAELKIEDISVVLELGVTGDLVATVSGSQGLSGTIKLAEVVNPVTVTAEKTNVQVGVAKQAAGDIVISEYDAGALNTDDGNNPVTLTLPDGVKFSSKPTVEVTKGDIEIDHISLTNDDKTLSIYFKDDSGEASTIKISNIYYDVDRTVAEADIQVKVGGDALVDSEMENYISGADDYIVKVANATVITPAPSTVKREAVFTLNSTTYSVNGEQMTMDVAPYLKDGRTYLPVRYVGYALGISPANVLWDNSTRTATFIKGNRVVQVTVASKVLKINGASVTMDVAAEMKNGRVMVPFRWIAQAFGAQVDWNGTSQTVTVTLQE
jgi:hypothetical protein